MLARSNEEKIKMTTLAPTQFSTRFMKRFLDVVDDVEAFAQGTIAEVKAAGGYCFGFADAGCHDASPQCVAKARHSQQQYELGSRDGLSEIENIANKWNAKYPGSRVAYEHSVAVDQLADLASSTSNQFQKSAEILLIKKDHLTRLSIFGSDKCSYVDVNGGVAKGSCRDIVRGMTQHLGAEYDGAQRAISVVTCQYSLGSK